jgi:transposase
MWEQLIGEEHPARAIWELVGRLDLDGFYEGIECSAEEGGRPAYDPRLLISLWIYAYSQGIGSAREVARRGEWEPALQWLTGCETVNYQFYLRGLAKVQMEMLWACLTYNLQQWIRLRKLSSALAAA